jgi:broad-specificity NMP kinase
VVVHSGLSYGPLIELEVLVTFLLQLNALQIVAYLIVLPTPPKSWDRLLCRRCFQSDLLTEATEAEVLGVILGSKHEHEIQIRRHDLVVSQYLSKTAARDLKLISRVVSVKITRSISSII